MWWSATCAALGGETRPLIPLAWPESGSAYQVEFVQSLRSPEDLGVRRSAWSILGRVLTGESERPRRLVRPFGVAGSSLSRLLITDSAFGGAVLLDRSEKKYAVLAGPGRERLRSPVGAALDAAGNLYVTDSDLGKIFVFSKNGRFNRFVGDSRGEGLYKRPTGISIDQASGEIYITETLRHRVLVLDQKGAIVREWGQRGEGPGEFNFPVSVTVHQDRVFVLDAMNGRVQVFDRKGRFLSSFGKLANEPGSFIRPRGLAFDPRNNLVFVVDAMLEAVQAFRPDGKLAFAFGSPGESSGQFRLPAGVVACNDGLLLVADVYNGRIQVFRITPTQAGVGGSE